MSKADIFGDTAALMNDDNIMVVYIVLCPMCQENHSNCACVPKMRTDRRTHPVVFESDCILIFNNIRIALTVEIQQCTL